MPYEFRTKESEAHGLNSPGRRRSGKKTKMNENRARGGTGVRIWEAPGSEQSLPLVIPTPPELSNQGHASAGDEGHCGPMCNLAPPLPL